MRKAKTDDLLREFAGREIRRGLTERNVRRKSSRLEEFFSVTGKDAVSVTDSDVTAYLKGIQSNYRHNDVLRSLRQFFAFLTDEEEVLTSPVEDVPYRRIAFQNHLGLFSREEIRRLIEAPALTAVGKARDAAVLTLLYATGIRLGECASLDIRDLDLLHRELFVRKGKGGRERMVPLGEAAAERLSGYLDYRLKRMDADAEALFITRTGTRLREQGIIKMIHRRKKAAGVECRGVTHAFRHSCATHMLTMGAPIAAIGGILGHSKLGTTERYIHLAFDDLRGVHAKSHPKAAKEE